MLKKFIVATASLVAIFYTNSASARQWIVLNSEPYLAVDVDSIKGTGDTRTFWSKLIYTQVSNSSSSISFSRPRTQSVMSLTYVDCASNKIGVLRQVEYDSKGNVLSDDDFSHLKVPRSLRSPVPDSLGEAELLYVCSLRTANGGRQTVSSSRTSNRAAVTSRNVSFPRKSCGDPFQSQGTYWPVFIDGGNLRQIRTHLCNDAFSIVRERGIKSVQVASFTSYERALSFAQQVGGTVGAATRYVNGRVVN